MKTLKQLSGVVCGGVLGLALGVLAIVGLVRWSVATHPNDPSAAAVGILIIFTAPAGTILGGILGLLLVNFRPRWFAFTVLPLSLLAVAVFVVNSALHRMDRPRDFELEVVGTPGAEYFGTLSVDGREQQCRGTLPDRYAFHGMRANVAFVLLSPNPTDSIDVDLWANGTRVYHAGKSRPGISMSFNSVGYSQTFGGVSLKWSLLNDEEAEQLKSAIEAPRVDQ